MKKQPLNTLLFLITFAFTVSCTSLHGDRPVSKELTISKDVVPISSVNDSVGMNEALRTLKLFSDTANMTWEELSKVDSTKMATIKRLMSEFSSTKKTIPKKEVETLNQLFKIVKTNTLSPSSQFNNASLHRYNLFSDSLTNHVIRIGHLYRHTLKFKNSTNALIKSVEILNQEVMMKRVLYNKAAQNYNDYFWEKRTFMLQAKNLLPNTPIRACFAQVG